MAAEVRTFLFTDVEGSTRAWEADADRMADALRGHDRLLRSVIEGNGGLVFKHTGDGMCAVFGDAASAVRAAIDAQRVLTPSGLRVRMGVHAGAAERVDGDYFGLTLNRCARLMGLAHGGQVLVSRAVVELVHDLLPPGVSVLDLGEHLLRDLRRPERLFQVVADGLRREFPPLPRGHGHSGPRFRSSFIGRNDELVQLAGAVAGHRLVTVTGVGGCGKTRLAVELAVAIEHRFEDGWVFVDLAPVADPDLVAEAVGRALEMPPNDGRGSVLHEVVRFVAGREVLVVLDNCEHLLDTAGELTDALLEECPEVRVLATSREPLGLEGESVWRIPSLDETHSAELFTDRAGALGANNLDPGQVLDICRHLDGVPLAIELAAAQAAHLPLAEIRSLLDHRFRLLTGGSRRARQRHQTLQATMDWSYTLLGEDQRTLLRTVAAFSGGFTLEAAVAVTGAVPAQRHSLALALGALVDKSLVVLDVSSGRYRLLETVRLYARQKLAEAGDAAIVHDRHRRWMEASGPGPWQWGPLAGSGVDEGLDNLRAALDWCSASGDAAGVVRLATAWASVWFLTTRAAEALRWLEVAPPIDEQLSLDDRLAWRVTAGFCSANLMDGTRATELARAGLALAPPDHPAVPALSLLEVWMAGWRGDRDVVQRACARIRRVSGDDPIWSANADYFEAIAGLLAEDFEQVTVLLDPLSESQQGMRIGDPTTSLVAALHLLGRHAEASAAAARLDPGLGSYFAVLTDSYARMLAAVGSGDHGLAREQLRHMMAVVRSSYPHLPSAWGFVVQGAGVLASADGDHEDALVLFAGSRKRGLLFRYESAFVTGRHYHRRSRHAVPDDTRRRAETRGQGLSLVELVELAGRRGDAGPAPPS